MRTLLESAYPLFMLIAAIGGVITAVRGRRAVRLIGIGIALVAITNLLTPRTGPTTGAQLVGQGVGSRAGLACMFVGVTRLGSRANG